MSVIQEPGFAWKDNHAGILKPVSERFSAYRFCTAVIGQEKQSFLMGFAGCMVHAYAASWITHIILYSAWRILSVKIPVLAAFRLRIRKNSASWQSRSCPVNGSVEIRTLFAGISLKRRHARLACSKENTLVSWICKKRKGRKSLVKIGVAGNRMFFGTCPTLHQHWSVWMNYEESSRGISITISAAIAKEAKENYLGRILEIQNDAYKRYLKKVNGW